MSIATRKKVSLILLAVMLVATFTGCASSEPSDRSTPEPIEAAQTTTTNEVNTPEITDVTAVAYPPATESIPETLSEFTPEPPLTPSPTLPPAQTLMPTPEPTPEPTTYTEDYSSAMLALAVSLIEDQVKSSFGENSEVKLMNENVIMVNVWQDGLALEATLAAQGNQEHMKTWNDLVSATASYSDSLQKNLDSLDYIDNCVVMVNVLNDLNLENTLIISAGGVIISDVVGDSDW